MTTDGVEGLKTDAMEDVSLLERYRAGFFCMGKCIITLHYVVNVANVSFCVSVISD